MCVYQQLYRYQNVLVPNTVRLWPLYQALESTVKNVHHKFKGPKATSLHFFFCPTESTTQKRVLNKMMYSLTLEVLLMHFPTYFTYLLNWMETMKYAGNCEALMLECNGEVIIQIHWHCSAFIHTKLIGPVKLLQRLSHMYVHRLTHRCVFFSPPASKPIHFLCGWLWLYRGIQWSTRKW